MSDMTPLLRPLTDEARKAMTVFRHDYPEFTQALFIEAHGFARKEDLAAYLESFELVGMPA